LLSQQPAGRLIGRIDLGVAVDEQDGRFKIVQEPHQRFAHLVAHTERATIAYAVRDDPVACLGRLLEPQIRSARGTYFFISASWRRCLYIRLLFLGKTDCMVF
jgi:hypothetical protein